MDAGARDELERELRRRWEAGDLDAVATEALRAYGPEIFGFLVALHRDQADASDVFSTFTENLWRGLAKFGWQCTLRAWAYTVARNASHRFHRDENRHARRRAPLTGSSAVDEMAVRVRTETVEYLKTEQKDRFAALREALPEEDQMLLILRVDRRLSWDELARVMSTDTSEDDLPKESARLRKRFQLVKEKLRTMGERAGLLPPKGDGDG